MPSLLLGAGNCRIKKVHEKDKPEWARPLITLDMGTDCGADVIWDLENRPLPFPDEYFDELGAFDVLEHIGRCGDWRGFFDEFAEYWRIMKPGGTFAIIVPIGRDHFADPGHTRFFGRTWFAFLNQDNYRINLDAGHQMTDYRWHWKKNFNVELCEDIEDHHIGVLLRKA